jgi:hypothetical protein
VPTVPVFAATLLNPHSLLAVPDFVQFNSA